MSIVRLLLALLLALPALADEAPAEVTVEGQTKEGERLAEEAQTFINRAHEMQPTKERNAVLSDAAKLIRKAQAAYLLAAEINADTAKALDAKVTDLKGMLFWCNKSLSILVPEAKAVPVPPPDTPSDPASVPPALPAPPPLSEPERQRILSLLDEARKFSLKVDAGWETQDRFLARVRAARAKVARLQADFKPAKKPGQTREKLRNWDASRAELLREAQDYREKALAKEQEIDAWRAQTRWALERVEYFGDRALPLLVESMRRPNFPPTEELVDYVNRQLSEPAFRFTPLPPGPAPADPAAVQAVERLLSDLADASEEAGKLKASAELQESRLDARGRSLEDLEDWWKWRVGYDSNPDLKAAFLQEIEEAAKKAERSRRALEPKEEALRIRRGTLQAALKSLPPDRAPLIEAWRLRQPFLGAEDSALLESLRPSAP